MSTEFIKYLAELDSVLPRYDGVGGFIAYRVTDRSLLCAGCAEDQLTHPNPTHIPNDYLCVTDEDPEMDTIYMCDLCGYAINPDHYLGRDDAD